MKKVLFTILIILIVTTKAIAALSLNDIAMPARLIGLGKAATALGGDTSAIFSNPAGLSQVKNWGVTSMSSRFLDLVDYKLVGAALPSPFGVFGAGFISSTTAFYTTDRDMDKGGRIIGLNELSYYNNLGFLSYAFAMNEETSLGGSVKFLNQGSEFGTGSGYDADFGILYKTSPAVTVGICLQDIVPSTLNWDSSLREDIGGEVKVGAAVTPSSFEGLLVSADIDLIPKAHFPVTSHIGAEYKPIDFLAIRVGIDQKPIAEEFTSGTVNNLTAGVGLKYNNFCFDYAYYSDSDQAEASTHYFSLSIAQ